MVLYFLEPPWGDTVEGHPQRTEAPVIGRQLAVLRHASGLTQEQLAERAQVSVDVIRRLEQGQRRTARFATLHAIAAALGTEVSINFVVRESGSPDPGQDLNGSSRGRDSGSGEMKRRELLRLVTSATAVISIGGPAEPDLEQLATSAPGRLGRADLADLATLNAGLWAAFVMAQNKAEVGPAVWDQARRLTDALRRPQSMAVRKRVCALHAEVFQLAGEVLFDANRYADAGYCYTLTTPISGTPARFTRRSDGVSCRWMPDLSFSPRPARPAQRTATGV